MNSQIPPKIKQKGGGGISSSKENGSQRQNKTKKGGEISFSKENGSQRQKQMCTKNENMSHLVIFQTKNGKKVHQHDTLIKVDTKYNKIKNVHYVTA